MVGTCVKQVREDWLKFHIEKTDKKSRLLQNVGIPIHYSPILPYELCSLAKMPTRGADPESVGSLCS